MACSTMKFLKPTGENLNDLEYMRTFRYYTKGPCHEINSW